MAKSRRTDETVNVGADINPALGAFARLGLAGRALIAGLIAFAGVQSVRVAASFVGLFRDQEQADARIRRTLVSTGRYSAELERNIHAIAGRVSAVGVASRNEVKNAIQQLIQFADVADDKLDDTAFAIAGIARAHQHEIETVAETVAESLNDMKEVGVDTLGEVEKYLSAAERAHIVNIKNTQGALAAQNETIKILTANYKSHATTVDGSTDVYKRVGKEWTALKSEMGRIVHLLTGPIAGWIADGLPAWVDHTRNLFVMVSNAGLAFDLVWLKIQRLVGADVDAEIAAKVKAIADALEKGAKDLAQGGGGEPTTGGARRRAEAEDKEKKDREAAEALRTQDLRRAAEDRMAVLRATLQGRSDAEAAFLSAERAAQKQHNEAMRLLDDEDTRALGEALIEEAALKHEAAVRDRDEARIAARLAIEEDLAQMRERMEKLEELKLIQRETGRIFDEEETEYLLERVRTTEEIQRDVHRRELDEMVRHREEMIAYEMEYGEIAARLKEALDAKQLTATKAFFADAAALQSSGNKKIAAIGRAAARASLLLDAATKPFEAFAKTSAAYAWPLGPILGAAHAAIVAAKIGVGLAAVGGGAGAGAGGSPSIGTPGRPEDTRPDDRPIILNATIEADGESIARVVQRRLGYADNE